MAEIRRCESIVENYECKLMAGHPGSHDSRCGMLWEDTIKLSLKRVQNFIVVGKNSQIAYLLTEYITCDGRKFFKRDYQINEIKKEKERIGGIVPHYDI